MKILWLYKYVANYNFDKWIHLEFARNLSKTENVELKAYGMNIHEGYPDLCLTPYNQKITIKDLKSLFNFDVIIMNTKSRMFEYYCPKCRSANRLLEERINQWLPKGIENTNTLKIMLEEDYHYEFSDNWYKEMGIDLLIHSHYANYLECRRRNNMRTLWLPFSVDTNIFKPNLNIVRNRKIAFAGSQSETVYLHRAKVSQILKPIGLLESFSQRKINESYVKCLQNYVSHLNGSSIYNITPAKMFEIMASGSLLFTNESDKYGLHQLFTKDTYFTYKEDYSDVIDKAKIIINEPDYVKEITKKAIECINQRHTNKIRIRELLEIIKRGLR